MAGWNNVKFILSYTCLWETNWNHFILLFRSPHVNGIFGPLGEMLKIKAKSPLDGATATLEFHSLKSIMSRQPGCKELKAFPGPLVPGKTDKLDVIRYVFYHCNTDKTQ